MMQLSSFLLDFDYQENIHIITMITAAVVAIVKISYSQVAFMQIQHSGKY